MNKGLFALIIVMMMMNWGRVLQHLLIIYQSYSRNTALLDFYLKYYFYTNRFNAAISKSYLPP